MKAYKVEQERLSFDWGRFEGWDLVGYYFKKEKAEAIAKERYENRCKVVQGKVKITEIEIED